MLTCILTVDMTDEELKECIHRMYPLCQSEAKGFTLTISGYDDDPRELWEIPEAVKFCQKLLDIGFPAVLDIGSRHDDLPGHPGFGLIEIWFVASGRIKKKGDVIVTPEDYKTAMKMMIAANEKVAKILAEPCPNTGMEQKNFSFRKPGPINEGSHRHRRK